MQRVTHGFELHCKTEDQISPADPNNLEINFSGGDNFHLTTLTQAVGRMPIDVQRIAPRKSERT